MDWLWYVIFVYALLCAFLYVVSVVITYGLLKNTVRQINCLELHASMGYGYDWVWEVILIFLSLILPLGMIVLIVQTLLLGRSLGFCYRMPKKLRRKRK